MRMCLWVFTSDVYIGLTKKMCDEDARCSRRTVAPSPAKQGLFSHGRPAIVYTLPCHGGICALPSQHVPMHGAVGSWHGAANARSSLIHRSHSSIRDHVAASCSLGKAASSVSGCCYFTCRAVHSRVIRRPRSYGRKDLRSAHAALRHVRHQQGASKAACRPFQQASSPTPPCCCAGRKEAGLHHTGGRGRWILRGDVSPVNRTDRESSSCFHHRRYRCSSHASTSLPCFYHFSCCALCDLGYDFHIICSLSRAVWSNRIRLSVFNQTLHYRSFSRL